MVLTKKIEEINEEDMLTRWLPYSKEIEDCNGEVWTCEEWVKREVVRLNRNPDIKYSVVYKETGERKINYRKFCGIRMEKLK